MLVFSITVVLAIASFVTYQKVSINLNVKKDIEAIKYSQASVRSAFKMFPTYYMSNEVHIMQFLKVSGYFKDDEVNSEGTTRNHYGDMHNIYATTRGPNGPASDGLLVVGSTFAIDYFGVPKSECMILAKKLKKEDFYMLTIGSVEIFRGAGYEGREVFATDEKIIEGCKSNNNSFYLHSQ